MTPSNKKPSISIILPARNEAESLANLLPQLKKLSLDAEIIVVNDGSEDDTQAICKQHQVRILNHPYSMGNGAAIKKGARAATGDILVFLDADGQHNPSDIPKLLDKLAEGFDMVVGARQPKGHASFARRITNKLYNRIASFMTGFKIVDLTSGFRAVKAKKFRRFLYLLPNGFSYPTTITMAFFRSGYSIAYEPIVVQQRKGMSKIKLFQDGLRFFIIILKVGALFSPMRLFLPVSFALFAIGMLYYFYTYIFYNRFTNMSALLFISSLFTFLIGIISEQISSIHYKNTSEDYHGEN